MFTTSNSRKISLTGFALFALMAASFVLAPPAQATNTSHSPNFGPNVYIFNPSMPLSQIQATVDSIANQQVSNQFGTQRYACCSSLAPMDPAPTLSTFRSGTTPA